MDRTKHRDRTFARFMVGPAVTLLFLVTIGPLLFSLAVSFTNLQFSTPQPMRWVGIDNYSTLLFNDSRFLSAMGRTLVFVLAGVVIQTLLGFFIASLLLKVQRYRAFLLGPILIPSVISSVVAAWQGRMIFNASYGPLNDVLAHIGIKGPAWLALPQTALVSVFLTDTWQWTPFLALIILAALQSQPLELLEAARLDGARGWSMFRRITLPLILPVAGVGVLLRGVDLFKTFDLVYILTQGGPGNSSETLTFLTYLQGFKFFNPSYASAMSFIQLIVITIVAKSYLGLMNKRGAI
ncbi:MAG: sugar ABC transporter permease [Verrucomicrobia bacterium]|nr:sugar ABC transporter permease [Verrucomicrobiota bacterium]MBV8481771.1 sugar ABC transporter permease [Verrucomicrobiota bacterium]